MVFIPGISDRWRRRGRRAKPKVWYCQECSEPQPKSEEGLRVVKKQVLVLKICRMCALKYTIQQLEQGAKRSRGFIYETLKSA